MGKQPNTSGLLPGTLDLLILRSLTTGRMHGYGMAQRMKEVSDDVLQVGESSLDLRRNREAGGGIAGRESGQSNSQSAFWLQGALVKY
jgi:PadR family transcriptional regulator, regulatory protein PadR